MIKLVGSLCVLFAGGSVWWLQHQEQRRRRQVLAELAAALERMETSIRLNRTPLLPLFRQAARGRCRGVGSGEVPGNRLVSGSLLPSGVGNGQAGLV